MENKKIFAKKSLGQNFLKSESALKKIVSAGEVAERDFVLEIGPGKGSLTQHLLGTGAKLFAVEADRELVDFLNKKFYKEIKSGQLFIINEDIINFDMKSLKGFSGGNYKIIANIPYYITGEIIRKFLSSDFQPEKMVLLVQKEVADRIMSRDKKESILSISVKIYSAPKYFGKVPSGSFTPAPKVDSAILAFENISKEIFRKNKISEKDFFDVLKAGFSHKRKRLFSNLKNKFSIDENIINKNIDIDKNIRAENLDIDQWVKLTKFIFNK